jgi:phosphoglycerate kinase
MRNTNIVSFLWCSYAVLSNRIYFLKFLINISHYTFFQDMNSCVDRPTSYLHVQTLRDFPVEKLFGEVVLVRLDSVILLDPLGSCNLSLRRTLSTIKYLYKAGAKVLLVTSWDPVLQSVMPVLNSTESLAG